MRLTAEDLRNRQAEHDHSKDGFDPFVGHYLLALLSGAGIMGTIYFVRWLYGV